MAGYDYQKDDSGERVQAGGTHCGLEYIEEGEAGGVVNGGVDIWHCEKICDYEGNGHDAVSDVGPE